MEGFFPQGQNIPMLLERQTVSFMLSSYRYL